ncbi:uncharacterized protein LOC111319048 [Stylophora pistillata]|uniref:uncharacterized protein LOC111319048 n=1 Tax=Stylophora pistillata TaxID=50429 RepID=UPI000C0539C8|nr:uncharacterized protein LOC111319048 [Stylophora pistillata]
MAANEQQMTPLEIEDTSCKQRQEEIVDEQDPSIGPVQVKPPSRPRRKVIVIGACIIVVVIVIVAAVLIGICVSRKDEPSDNGKNKTVNEGTGEGTESIRTSTVETTIAKSSAALSHFSSSEAKTAKSSAPLSHFSADASIVKSSPSATKSFEVTSYTPSHFHKTTTPPFLKMTSTSLVSFSSTDLPSASTMFSGTTPLPSNTTAAIASPTISSLSSS